MRRNLILSLLICVNVILGVGLIVQHTSLPAAFAQSTSLAGDYLVVAGEIQDQHDALYLLDPRNRALHVLYYDRGRKILQYAASRDLEMDFRRNRGG